MSQDQNDLLTRLDERTAWMVEELKSHRQDYRDLLTTVNSHGKWLHVGKLIFVIAGGAILAKDYIINWISSGRH